MLFTFIKLKSVGFAFQTINYILDYAYNNLYGRLRLHILVNRADLSAICSHNTTIKGGENIEIGKGVTIGPYGVLGAASASLKIGNYTRIARGVVIETGNLKISKVIPYYHESAPIIIEDGVILYSNVIITAGVTVGRGSIIGAGTVITRNVPPYSIVTKSPNQIVMRRPSERTALNTALEEAKLSSLPKS